MSQPVSRYAKGVMGEDAALRFLCGMGMELLDQRYRANGGEIDLVLLDGDILAFVEVKARMRGGRLAGQAAITPLKQRRLIAAARAYLGQHPEHAGRMVRFDVVTVTGDGVEHIPNAFTGSEW